MINIYHRLRKLGYDMKTVQRTIGKKEKGFHPADESPFLNVLNPKSRAY